MEDIENTKDIPRYANGAKSKNRSQKMIYQAAKTHKKTQTRGISAFNMENKNRTCGNVVIKENIHDRVSLLQHVIQKHKNLTKNIPIAATIQRQKSDSNKSINAKYEAANNTK